MSQHDTSPELPDYVRSRRSDRWVLVTVAVSLFVASGCGAVPGALFPQASIEIITGKDSAGATIELEKRGEDLTRARVIDIVLGTGEGEIISAADGQVEFTIEFPAGVTLTYVGTVQNPSAASVQEVVGKWTQLAQGVFGVDTGTWSATAETTDK